MSESFESGHALLIGVGADLPDTVNDARGMADILKDEGHCAYPPAHVTLLTGESADRPSILATLDRLAQEADDKATVVVYFSGHGHHVSSSMGEAYYLMPYNYDIKCLSQTAISGSEFVGKLKAIKAQKLLLLLDCCHAGGMSDLKAPGLQLSKAPLPPEAQGLFAEGQGRVVIASSQADEYSLAGKPYSAFTLALIEALCGEGASEKDGYVRVSDLALHTRQMVPKRTNDRQHPILRFRQADDFVLAYYAGGETKPKGLPFAEEPEIEPEPGAWSRTFDQRRQTVYGSQTNIAGNVQGVLMSGNYSGTINIGETKTKTREPDTNHKESKASLTARYNKQEKGTAIIEIKNIGQATATNIRISFAGSKNGPVLEGKGVPIPREANILPGESISIPICCSDWKDIYVDMRWADDADENNINRSYIRLEPI
jgi:hypothetical protein